MKTGIMRTVTGAEDSMAGINIHKIPTVGSQTSHESSKVSLNETGSVLLIENNKDENRVEVQAGLSRELNKIEIGENQESLRADLDEPKKLKPVSIEVDFGEFEFFHAYWDAYHRRVEMRSQKRVWIYFSLCVILTFPIIVTLILFILWILGIPIGM